MSLMPQTYDEWEHCITVKCGLPLTAEFVSARIEALENDRDHQARKFVEVWGERHRAQALEWFREAAARLDR